MGPQVERQRHDNQGADGCEEGEGCAPSPEIFLNFYIKIVSFRAAFCAAISYRLANCFTRIGNTPGIEIYWHFGN